MSMTVTLSAEKRTDSGKGVARKLRAAGRIPAVVYGQGEEATTLTVDAHEAGLLFQRISVENTIVDLDIDGEAVSTLVREVQVHPFKPNILHIDFYKIEKGVEVDVEVPLVFEGTPYGVRLEGGRLQLIKRDLPVRTIPSKIPDEIRHDISDLKAGETLHAEDVELPEGVTLTIDGALTLLVIESKRGGKDADEGDEEAEEGGEAEG